MSQDKANIEKFLSNAGRASDIGAGARRGAQAPPRAQATENRRLLEQALQQAMSSFATPQAPQAPAPVASTPDTAPAPAAESETTPLLGESRPNEASAIQTSAPSTTNATDDIDMLQLQEFEDMDPEEAAMLAEAIRLSQQQADSSNDNSGSNNNNDSQNPPN